MAEVKKRFAGVERRQEVSPASRREDTRTWFERFHDAHSDPKVIFWWYLRLSLVAFVLMPFPFMPEMVLLVAFYFAAANLFYKNRAWHAPFRVPAYLGMKGFKDASSKEDGRRGQGYIFLGTGQGEDEGLEVWASPSDVRTHRLVVGTTGSGKTEELYGELFNALMLQSGAILIDGKGSQNTHHRILSMSRMFGREQELLLLSFMMGAEDFVGSSPTKRSNTSNPFSSGSSPVKAEILKNLLGEQKGGDPSWRQRAENLIDGLMPILTFLHNRGHLLFNARTLVEFMKLETVENLTMFGLVRGVHGQVIDLARDYPHDFANLQRYAAPMIQALMQSLPSYSMARPQKPHRFSDLPVLEIDRALASGRDAVLEWAQKYVESFGQTSEMNTLAGAQGAARQQASQQWGFLVMQVFVAVSQLSYIYGHIFDEEVGEIDWRDVILNRRLIYATLPSVDRSKQSRTIVGRFAVSCVSSAIGRMLDTSFEGDSRELVEGRPFNARMPFSVLLDEYTHYAVPGFSIVPAQAREFGLALTFGMQEIDGLGQADPVELAQTFENTNLRMLGRYNGGTRSQTWEKMSGAFGEADVMVAKTAFYDKRRVGGKFETGDEVVKETVSRVNINDVQGQENGDFHLSVGVKTSDAVIERSGVRVIRYKAFYTGDIPKIGTWRLNHFVTVLPPSTREMEDRRIAARTQLTLRQISTAKVVPVLKERRARIAEVISKDFVARLARALADVDPAAPDEDIIKILSAINQDQSTKATAGLLAPLTAKLERALGERLAAAEITGSQAEGFLDALRAVIEPQKSRIKEMQEGALQRQPLLKSAVELLKKEAA